MIQSYEYFYNIIIYNLILKNSYKNFYKIPFLKKITLHFSLKNIPLNNKKKLINFFLLLVLINNQQPKIIKSKKNNLNLKIKKNMIIGCKIILRKKELFLLVDKLLIFIFFFRKKKNILFKITEKQNILNFKIINLLSFYEIHSQFLFFQNLNNLDISIYFDNIKILNEFHIILSELLFPIQKFYNKN